MNWHNQILQPLYILDVKHVMRVEEIFLVAKPLQKAARNPAHQSPAPVDQAKIAKEMLARHPETGPRRAH